MGGNLVHSREEEVYCCGKYTGINYTHSKRNCCCCFFVVEEYAGGKWGSYTSVKRK